MKESKTNARKPVAKTAKKMGRPANKASDVQAKQTRSRSATPVRKAAKPTVQRKSVAGRRPGSTTSKVTRVPKASATDLKQHIGVLTTAGYTVMVTKDFDEIRKAQLEAERTVETSDYRIDMLRDMVTDRDTSINKWKAVSASLLIIAVAVAIWG